MLRYPLGNGEELGPLEPWHAEEYLAAVEASRAHLLPWIPHATSVIDVETSRALLQRFADGHAADTLHFFGIWVDGVLVGTVLFPVFNPAMGVCEIGVWLAPEVEGRGLVNRAAGYLIDWAIRVRGMGRVEWRTNPLNTRSSAAAKRLGLTREGVLRSAFVLNGVRVDAEVWSVLAEEWRG